MEWDQNQMLAQLIDSLCLCVKSGAKPAEMTVPMKPDQFRLFSGQLQQVIQKHGLHCYLEDNAELQNEQRYLWYLIYQDEKVFKEYYILRLSGKNPAVDFDAFRSVFFPKEKQTDRFWDGDNLKQTYDTLFRSW